MERTGPRAREPAAPPETTLRARRSPWPCAPDSKIWLLQQSGAELGERGASRKPSGRDAQPHALKRRSRAPARGGGRTGGEPLLGARDARELARALDSQAQREVARSSPRAGSRRGARRRRSSLLALLLARRDGGRLLGRARSLLLTRAATDATRPCWSSSNGQPTRVAEGDLTAPINLRVGRSRGPDVPHLRPHDGRAARHAHAPGRRRARRCLAGHGAAYRARDQEPALADPDCHRDAAQGARRSSCPGSTRSSTNRRARSWKKCGAWSASCASSASSRGCPRARRGALDSPP